MNFTYTLAGGTATGNGPSVTYVSEGVQQNSILPKPIWCDAGSAYAFGQGLGGNTTTERWILTSGTGTGLVTMGSTGTGNVLSSIPSVRFIRNSCE